MVSTVSLSDGRVLGVRVLGPGDGEVVQAFVRSLSRRSRTQRFFSPIAELSPRQLERALNCEGLHIAAIDGSGAIVALAQYALEGDGEAEFGVVVGDAWQGQGIGAQLLQTLLDEARRSGLARLGGVTQADNDPMRLLARRLGFQLRPDPDPRLVRMERALAA
ncbi:MAG TPA: GNAT family N-acetyltransferase [Burkholderiales bacterium]|nr:GNAT family N-acetyltransferase [Burkholderiales bacterium]